MPLNKNKLINAKALPFNVTIRYVIILVVIVITASCKSVKPYQKQYLNDHYMQANALPVEKLESEADSYREGIMGGMDGKSGGGCGCN